MPAPMIETARTILRPWHDADVDEWVRMCANPRVMEFFPSVEDRPTAEAGAKRVRGRLEDRGYGWWVLEVKDVLPFAGVIVLQDVPGDWPFCPAREVGWRLVPEVWGNGYATEGADAALDYAFTCLLWPEVVAMTARINVRSQRVMQRLGMTNDSADDFELTIVPPDHPIRRHVLYRLRRSSQSAGQLSPLRLGNDHYLQTTRKESEL